MKKYLLISLLLLPLFMLANEKETPLKPQKVTVFLSGAQISATAKVYLTEGNNELIFSNLSPNVRPNSIQVKGLNQVSVNSIQFDVTYLKEKDSTAEVQDLKDKIEALKDKIALKQSAIDALETEESLLMQNKKISSTETTTSLAKLKEYATYYRERSEAIYNLLYQRKKERDELQETIHKLELEIYNKDSENNSSSRGQITLSLASETAQNATLEITYFVEDAGWYPNYELRAKDVNSPVNLLYQANVFQNTGDDWKDVEVTLSTADPSMNNIKPSLLPYYLDFNLPRSYNKASSRQSNYKFNPSVRQIQGVVTDTEGIPLPAVFVSFAGFGVGTETDFDGRYNLEVPSGAEIVNFEYLGFNSVRLPVYAQNINVSLEPDLLDEVVVTGYARSKTAKLEDAELEKANQVQKSEALTVMNFKLPKNYSITSGDEPLKVKLDQQDLEAEYEYYVAPALDLKVYLTATLQDWQALDLLPGEASVYFEDTFTGQIFIDANMNTEDFVVSLGNDQNIVVERTQVNKMKSKSFFRNNEMVEKEYEISIKNNKNIPVEVKLEDRIPISQNEDIKVSDERFEGAIQKEETGVITWDIRLNAKAKQTQSFAYKVTYPKGKRVNVER